MRKIENLQVGVCYVKELGGDISSVGFRHIASNNSLFANTE